VAVLVIVVWAITGPLFHFSNTWQLVINTGTTIVTFLMVFLIQNSQNRDSEAVQLKLDELIRAMKSADNSILDTENLTEEALRQLQDRYTHLAQVAEKKLSKNNSQAS
jgi:low affinity Fe/Cu permease